MERVEKEKWEIKCRKRKKKKGKKKVEKGARGNRKR